jgi:delta14-sterol reductase/lamin-B receptor
VPLGRLYDIYPQLIAASVLFSFALSIYLYTTSLLKQKLKLADGGQSDNMIYDFFIGRELNPRIGEVDLKVFCELRPGLIGWAVLNLGCAFKQYENLGYVSLPMVAVNAFEALYVWDALYNERAILTTMDVTTDGFGFMLAFGDLAWVPFTYSL